MDGGRGNRPLECPLSQPPPPTPASTLSTATSPVLRPRVRALHVRGMHVVSLVSFRFSAVLFPFSLSLFLFLFFWFSSGDDLNGKEGYEFLCDLCIKWNIDIPEMNEVNDIEVRL